MADLDRPGFDVDAYRSQLRSTWDALGPAWERWQDFFERGAADVTAWLLDAAGVTEGDRVLDVATGAGEPALSAARVVGPSGRVVGIDQSATMVEVAQRRAGELSNTEFVVDDVEQLRFPDAGFEVVLSRFGLMFAADQHHALARIAAVLVPGGRLAFATWIDPPRAPVIGLAFGVAAGLLELPPPPPGTPGPFSMGDADALRRLLVDVGFVDVRAEEVPATFTARSMEEFVDYATATLPPWLRARLAERFGPEPRELNDAVAQAAKEFVGAGGDVRLPCVALCVSARRP